MRSIYIFLISMLSFSVKGQLFEEIYSKFISDSSLTTWTVYKYDPFTNIQCNTLSFHSQKNCKSRLINEKTFNDDKEIKVWTISLFNENWQIIEIVDLNFDSTIMYRELFTYEENGRISSRCYDEKGNEDTTIRNSFYSDGTLSSSRFLHVENDSNSFWYETDYLKGKNNLLERVNIYRIDKDEKKRLTEYYQHYYTLNRIDSIKHFDSTNICTYKKVFSYRNNKIDLVYSSGHDIVRSYEKYQYFYKSLISILYYNDFIYFFWTILIQ